MGFSVSEQMVCLLWSVVLGLVLGVLYDVFRMIRLLIFTSNVSVFICDFLFMVISGFFSVVFSMGFSRGNTRYFIILGEILGFLFYRLTIGRFTVSVVSFLSQKIGRILKITADKIRKFAKRVLQVIKRILYNIFRKKRVSENRDKNYNT